MWELLMLICMTLVLIMPVENRNCIGWLPFKAGLQDSIFGANYYSNSKKLARQINISVSGNNVKIIIGFKRLIV